jgi:accessory colonization factor AcfC
MKKESRERIKDMISLMDDGYGKSVVCFDDLLNTGLNVFHDGGANAIAKSTNAWMEIMSSVAKVCIGLRIAISNFAPHIDTSNVKTSDMIKVDIRYMESSEEAGMRLEIRAGETGIDELDRLIHRVMPILLSDEVNSLSVVE